MAVLSREMAQIYVIKNGETRWRNASRNDAHVVGPQAVDWPTATILKEDDREVEYILSTREANISPDGRKIALCSYHVQGFAVIRLLVREDSWTFWGTHQIELPSDHRDWTLPGLTGISL